MKLLRTTKGVLHAFYFTPVTIVALIFLLPGARGAETKPRAPLPPWPEIHLAKWAFDEPLLAYAQRSSGQPVTIDRTTWIESWSAYALNRQNATVQPLILPMATTNQWNLAPDEGAIRVWYAPAWSSSNTGLGHGPGHYARLLELYPDTGSVLYWSLYVSPDGNTLYVSGNGQEGPADFVKTDIQWQAGQWHLLSLSYGSISSLLSPVPWARQEADPDETRATVLHLDGKVAAVGQGVLPVPAMLAAATRLSVGSRADGKDVAAGQLEELTAFARPITAWELGAYFEAYRKVAALGPVTPEEEAARLAAALARQTEKEATGFALGASALGAEQGGYFLWYGETNGLYLTPPLIEGTNVSLTLWNADTNKSYNIYYASALLNSNTVWSSIAALGLQGQTNFSFWFEGDARFFRAFEGNDWDWDGSPNYMDAQPYNSAVSNLTVTIEWPSDRLNLD
jgi:hypothetical protein